MEWNILIVDDEREQAETTKAAIGSHRTAAMLGEDAKLNILIADGFEQALNMISYTNFDVIILDLKDEQSDGDDPDAELSGERVLTRLREKQFTPVIFYTGYSQKVEHQKGAFVKVVRKGTEPAKLREALAEISKTNMPQLLRHLQEEQRKYLWDHVEKATQADHGQSKPSELAFLLGRRLANALSGRAIRQFFDSEYQDADQIAHPVELYIWPPMGESISFGDILEKRSNDTIKYFVVLNPACDFVQNKAEKVLLAECDLLSAMQEHIAVANHRLTSDEKVSKTATSALRSLLCDNRQIKGIQAERYKFLPGTSFLPNLIIDYQKLSQVPVGEIHPENGFMRIATLDTPFAEAMQSRYIRYYGRIGTPDLEWDNLVNDMIEILPKKN